MVRDVRRDVAGRAAAGSPVKGSSVEPAPVEPEPEADAVEAADGPEELSADPGSTEQVAEIPEDESPSEDPDASAGPSTATTGVITEEPIRLDDPEPARSGRSDEEEEGSLRELFWGEE